MCGLCKYCYISVSLSGRRCIARRFNTPPPAQNRELVVGHESETELCLVTGVVSCEQAEITGSALKVANKKAGRRELPRNHRYPRVRGDAFGRRRTKRAGGGGRPAVPLDHVIHESRRGNVNIV